MEIRAYRPGDGPALAALFYETVPTVNAADYTEEQLDAWAPGTVDLDRWDLSFREHDALLAVEGETILGFGDMDRTGYLDRCGPPDGGRGLRHLRGAGAAGPGKGGHPRLRHGQAFF